MKTNIKKYKVILWGAWYGSRNVGDQVLLLSISDMLGGAIDNAEFIVISASPELVYEYIKRDSVYRFRAFSMRAQTLELIKVFMTADLFVFGGGVPFYDETSHSVAIAILVTLARLFKVPYILWSVSSLPIRSRFTRFVLRYVLSKASLIACRDRYTYRLFRECGIKDGDQQIIPDAAFTLRSADEENARNLMVRAGWHPGLSRPLVALTPRLLRGRDGEAHTHYIPKTADDNQKEVDVFSAVLDWLWENGYQPIFVPMNTVPPDDDRESSRQIIMRARYGKNAFLINEEIFPRDAVNVYRYCHAAFVARVHGSITSFLGKCPVLMYAFGLKHIGIMEQMRLPRYIFNPDRNTKEDAVSLMSEILSLRIDLMARMEETHKGLLEQAEVPLEAALKFRKIK